MSETAKQLNEAIDNNLNMSKARGHFHQLRKKKNWDKVDKEAVKRFLYISLGI